MTVKEIHAKLNFMSDRTVYNLLYELILENRVFTSKQKYYLNLFFDDGWSVFARFLEEFMLRQDNLKELPLQKIHSNRYLFSGNLENEIHNFGNIIGAFIMYVLIESLRPNERLVRREARDEIWRGFLQNAVYLPYLLQRFRKQLPDSIDFYRIIIGGDDLSFDKLYNSFNNVYPASLNSCVIALKIILILLNIIIIGLNFVIMNGVRSKFTRSEIAMSVINAWV